jgi:methanogenic corrinoid protein MtbC1
MAGPDDSDDLFQHDVYEQSYSAIRNLKSRLPEDVVVSLAREVLRRLAEHRVAINYAIDPYPDDSVEALAHALIGDDPKQAADLVEARRREGAREDAIYLAYLAPAARRLGEWWLEDRVTFAQVTTGSGRIYAILRSLRPSFAEGPMKIGSKSALFAPVPGETHTLGVKMAADLLRQDDWEVELVLDLDHDTLVERIAKSDQRIIGLSAGGAYSLANLAKLVVAIRAWAPNALILISGQVVEEAADTVALMGPDAMAADLDGARNALDDLWKRVTQT